MMATGYVSPVADGEITDLRSFALQCSRAMTALIHLRDEPASTPPRQIPLDLVYYEERLTEAQERLNRLAMETEVERDQRTKAEYLKAMKAAEQYDAISAVQYDRVMAMRSKVEAWTGAPEGLKEFMLEQIKVSIGRTDIAPYKAADHVMRHDPDQDWKRAVEEVGRAHADIEREKALNIARNAWLTQLWAGLPDEGTDQ